MNVLKTVGTFNFNMRDLTKKHANQSSWKTSAMIQLDDDVQLYYQWFLKKRYGLKLERSIRGSHITFINDRTSEINIDAFEKMKKMLQGQKINVVLGLDPRSSGKHWWLNIPEEFRNDIHNVRSSVGLDRPNFGLHMTIGIAMAPLTIEHSNYITRLLTNKMIP